MSQPTTEGPASPRSTTSVINLVLAIVVIPLVAMCCIIGSVSLFIFARYQQNQAENFDPSDASSNRPALIESTIVVRSPSGKSTVSRVEIVFRSKDGSQEFPAIETKSGWYQVYLPSGQEYEATATHPEYRPLTVSFRPGRHKQFLEFQMQSNAGN